MQGKAKLKPVTKLNIDPSQHITAISPMYLENGKIEGKVCGDCQWYIRRPKIAPYCCKFDKDKKLDRKNKPAFFAHWTACGLFKEVFRK